MKKDIQQKEEYEERNKMVNSSSDMSKMRGGGGLN